MNKIISGAVYALSGLVVYGSVFLAVANFVYLLVKDHTFVSWTVLIASFVAGAIGVVVGLYCFVTK